VHGKGGFSCFLALVKNKLHGLQVEVKKLSTRRGSPYAPSWAAAADTTLAPAQSPSPYYNIDRSLQSDLSRYALNPIIDRQSSRRGRVYDLKSSVKRHFCFEIGMIFNIVVSKMK
jgi:hypothetical protein